MKLKQMCLSDLVNMTGLRRILDLTYSSKIILIPFLINKLYTTI